jgi:hypothetical protein
LNVESKEVKRRRSFTVNDKLRILPAAEKCKVRGELGAWLPSGRALSGDAAEVV